MKDIKQIVIENDNIFKWQDENVLDIEFERDGKSIARHILGTKCPVCDTDLADLDDEHITQFINDKKLTGMAISCKTCTQDYYIHFPPRYDASVEMDIKTLEV